MSNEIIITVGHENAEITGNTNTAIQSAVDKAAASGGGIVKILPGKYIMNDSLHLRSNVTVEGDGESTILWKLASVKSKVALHAGYGHYDISVEEPEKFDVGMGILITGNHSGGFADTVGTVLAKRGNVLLINRMLNNDYAVYADNDSNKARDSVVISVYPIISGYGVENACVKNLTVDGNAEENDAINGCRGGGIFIAQGRYLKFLNVKVKKYNGDGISFQQCVNTLIDGCIAEDITGVGIHPGSGSVGVVIRNTKGIRNGHSGLGFCFRVTRTLLENCIFSDNGCWGIGIAGRDTDIEIRNCEIERNGYYGIHFYKDIQSQTGNNTLIADNIIRGNGTRENKPENTSDIFIDCKTTGVYIYNNHGAKIKATDKNYLEYVTFRAPGDDYTFSSSYIDRQDIEHLGPWEKIKGYESY